MSADQQTVERIRMALVEAGVDSDLVGGVVVAGERRFAYPAGIPRQLVWRARELATQHDPMCWGCWGPQGTTAEWRLQCEATHRLMDDCGRAR